MTRPGAPLYNAPIPGRKPKPLIALLRRDTLLMAGLVAALWVIEVVNLLTGQALLGFGIRSRDLPTVWTVLTAPWLHASIAHLAANTIPFFVLGWMVLLRGLRAFLWDTAVIVLVGGLLLWLVGPPNTVTVGASGLIFGFLGLLLARGFFERRVGSMLLAVVVAVLYGGALWGLLPGVPGVSWQGHLTGALTGVGLARLEHGRSSAGAATR